MVFETNKEKGNSGLGAAIQYYSFQGCTVSIPLNDTQDYDLIVEKEGELKKVQVKATGQLNRYGKAYVVSVRSCGGTKGTAYKTVKDTNVDLLFVLTGDGELYEIPREKITQTSAITLGEQMQNYLVGNAF